MANNKSEPQAVNASTTHHKLWISDEWYIPIDDKGLCVGVCSEGALGFIIQLKFVGDEEGYAALKIPRLMAETHRENAYICQLMEQEQATVEDIFRGVTTGLLRASSTSNLLKKPITIKQLEEDGAKEWDDALVFVKFEKSQNPYFCLGKIVDNTLKKWPEGAELPTIDAKGFELLEKAARDKKPWSKTVFIEKQHTASKSVQGGCEFFHVDQAFQKGEMGQTWYTCLPSVIYQWAPLTLQEAISLSRRGGNWTLQKHLQLVERVCIGLQVLHRKGFLHADVRPANIVCEENSKDPDHYSLTDYGSLSSADPKAGTRRGGNFSGKTVIGPIIEGERASEFYAPERRSGQELETADTAIIVKTDDTTIYIILGWKSKLRELGYLNAEDKPIQDTQHYVNKINGLPTSSDQKSSELLQKGDHIQIRDYIFELTENERIGPHIQAFPCHAEYWTVYHGRIVVKSDESHFKSACHVLSVPRVIRLLQWSASTDLYSLGVLALYSVYWDAQEKIKPRKSKEVAGEQSNTPNTETSESEANTTTDNRFREMLTYLANKSLFNAIWPRLEWVRDQLETMLNYNPNIDKDKFANSPVEEASGNGHEPSFSEDTKNLKDAAIEIVSQINQTVPGIENLLEVLDYQLGEFIFYMHFVLRCLHREDEMDAEKGWGAWAMHPFCKNRYEPPEGEQVEEVQGDDTEIITEKGETRAISKALIRLYQIKELINNAGLKGFKAERNQIAKFDLRSVPEIQQAISRLEDEKENLDKKLKLIREPVNQAFELMDKSVVRYMNFLPSFRKIKDNFAKAHQRIGDSQVDNNKHGEPY